MAAITAEATYEDVLLKMAELETPDAEDDDDYDPFLDDEDFDPEDEEGD